MAKINHNISAPNDGLGDQLRTAFGNQNAMNTELYEAKVDKVNGKGLSANDYTNIDKAKVDAIVVGAEVNVQSDWAQGDDTQDDYIKNKPTDYDFSGFELNTNKQDSLITDGTGTKYPTVDAVSGALVLKEDKTNKNTANGYAGLGADGKVADNQLNIATAITSGVASTVGQVFGGNKSLSENLTIKKTLTVNEKLTSVDLIVKNNLSVGGTVRVTSSFVSPDLPITLVQGYAFDGTSNYIFGTSTISKRNSSWVETVFNSNALLGITGVNHLGDGVYLGGFLYAPVETYILNGSTGMKIAKYDATTLAIVSTYDISAQGHEASSITTDGSTLYISSYDDGTKFWKYSLTGTFLGIINISTPFTNNIQGISYYNNELYISEQTKLSKIDITGAVTTNIGEYTGVFIHRGEGIQVVDGVIRVLIANESNVFTNVHYFNGTTTVTSPKFNVDNGGNTNIQGYTSMVGGTSIGNGATAELNFSSSVSSGASDLVVRASVVNQTTQIKVLPNGSSAIFPAILINDSSTSATGSNTMLIGRGNSTLPKTNTHYIGSTVNGLAFSNSFDIGFLVSNPTDGRFSPMLIKNTGVVNISKLAGTGTRTVVADASGNLTATTTPAYVGYKVYTALLTQTGTTAPVATVLDNTLGGTVVFTRSSVGIYIGTLTGAFVAGKTITLGVASTHPSFLAMNRVTNDTFSIATENSGGTLTDSLLNGTSIEIRVYN
jgi:hypothetical protein